MRILLAIALLWGLVATPARAEELTVRVVRQAVRPVDNVVVEPLGARIDLGAVSVLGPPPRHVRRYAPSPDGAHFVTSIELEIVSAPESGAAFEGLSALRSRRVGRPAVSDARKGAPAQTAPLRGAALPPAPATLYASLASGDLADSDVRIVVGAPADWSRARDVGTPLGPAEVPLAFAVRPGDRVKCEVSVYASAAAVGPRTAVIRFDVR